MYPVMLNLKGRRCLVVGGGPVALRKVEGLILEGADVTVVASRPVAAIQEMAKRGDIQIELGPYESGAAADYSLVFAATDDRNVNRRVFEDAERARSWINVADDPELCAFHLPARMTRGAFQLAVASSGEAPFVVRRMRQLLEKRFGPEWSEWIEAASRFRRSVRGLNLPATEQEELFDAFFTNTVDGKHLRARVPKADEEASWISMYEKGAISKNAPTTTHAGADFRPARESRPGLVSLVGAGPGDPGLMTMKGRQRLLEADAIVCDRLAMTALPCDLTDRVEIRFVGKTAGRHPIPQEETNALLVRLAREGKRVVRLKGGDPYIFGRGGEEAEMLRSQGIPFEVVPGVTAAVAVPAYAGIPVTFRNEVVRVTLVTAHEAEKSGGPQVRWDLLARDPHAMLLGYMGVKSLPKVTEQLICAGMDPNTPAALIERGTTSRQRVVASTVAEICKDVNEAGLKPPALFAIGSAVSHMEALNWFGERPLLGERLVITRAAGAMREALELSGVEAVEVPVPITRAARMVMDALPLTGCVLMNPSDVDAIDEERDSPTWNPDAVAWCCSKEAARRAGELGWRNVEEIADPLGDGRALVEAMIARVSSR
jgi:uroporphyrin-III C-methyltransferase/precorrin-2 dehydrogenase/sirohydrochlorin ferrochelatase